MTSSRQFSTVLKITLILLSVFAVQLANRGVHAEADVFPGMHPTPEEIKIDLPEGTIFTITIWLDNAYSISSVSIDLYWDSYRLNLTGIQAGGCFPGGSLLIGAWNSEEGYVSDLTYGVLGTFFDIPQGQAFICTFRVLRPGFTIIHIRHIWFVIPPEPIYLDECPYQTYVYASETLLHEVSHSNHTYNVKTRSDFIVHPLCFMDADKTLYFNVTCQQALTGYVNVTIPEDLVHVDPDLPPYAWHVLIDDVFSPFSATENTTHTFIYIEYHEYVHTEHSINIMGYYLGSEEPDIEVYTTPALRKTVFGKGFPLQINVIVKNWYIRTENVNVTLYISTEPIATYDNIILNRTQYTYIAHAIDTTEIPYGNYTVRAASNTVPGETNTTNNELAYDVKVSIIGDFNGDYKVGPADFALLAYSYGSLPGNPKWNPNCDANGDWKVGSADFAYLSAYYGQHYP